MRLSEIIIRRKIRRIIQEAVAGVPTSTATGKSTYTANLVAGSTGGKLSFSEKLTRGVLGAIGLSVLYNLIDKYIMGGGSDQNTKSKIDMTATICGDSQAEGKIGTAVEAELKSRGYKVKRVGKAKAKPDAVLAQVQSAAKDSILVVAIFGGNASSPADASSNLVKMYEACEDAGAAFMAIGPPPPTKITSLPAANVGFPAYNITDENFWLNLPANDPRSKDSRKDVSDAMESATSSKGDINVWGISSRMTNPGDYPDQPDGIHCETGVDEVARKALAGLGIDAVTTELRRQIEEAQKRDADSVGRVGKSDEVTPQTFDKDKYKRGIYGPESSSAGGYTAKNPPKLPKYSGAFGKYQFLAAANTENLVQFLNSNKGYSLYAGGKYNGLRDLDCRSKNKTTVALYYELWEGFRNDAALQEDYMDRFFIPATRRVADNYYSSTRNDGSVLSKLDYAQLCAAIHFGGGAQKTIARLQAEGLNITPGGDNSTYAVYLSRFNSFYYKP